MSALNFSAAREVLGEAIAGHAFPSAAWGVLEDGRVLATEAAGQFTYDSASPAVSADTIYDLASVSKVMATTAIAMLRWQQGRLDLDAPLAKFLPDFAQNDSARRQVTLRMLLLHTSGLPAHVEFWRDARTPDEAFAACQRLPLLYPPGTHTEYSDIGFILLGRVLEQLAGMSLRDCFSQWIASPLGLRDTLYGPLLPELAARAAPTRDIHWRHRVLHGEVHDENCALLGGVAGHAGLFSTVSDVLRFADAILRPQISGLFRPETVAHFLTRHGDRTLGWDVPTPPSQSGRCFSPHSAGHLGYAGTSLWLDLDRKLAVTLLTNRVYTSDAATEPPKLIQKVRPRFHNALLAC